MSNRRAASACVLCAFALSPAASAFAQSGGAAAPTSSPAAAAVTSVAPLARTPAQRAALAQGGAAAPTAARGADAPTPATQAPPPDDNNPAGDAAAAIAVSRADRASRPSTALSVKPAVLRSTPALRPVQSADDTVEVPVPRAAEPAATAAPKLPMTGLDLGLLTSFGLGLLGSGLVIRGLAQPRGRSVTV